MIIFVYQENAIYAEKREGQEGPSREKRKLFNQSNLKLAHQFCQSISQAAESACI